jgi:hypothetical protein
MPQIILEQLRPCKEHQFSPEELTAYRETLIEKRIQAIKEELSGLQKSRDNNYFSTEEDQEELERLETRIENKRNQLAYYQKLEPGEVEVSEQKSIEFVRGEDSGQLLQYPLVSSKEKAKKHDLDLLISGVVEEVEGYFFVEVRGWNSHLEREVFTYTDGFSKEEIKKRVEQIGRNMWELVLGHPWALLTVTADPPHSDIYINDRFYAEGSLNNLILEPGTFQVRCAASGFLTQEQKITLEENAVRELNYSLKPELTGNTSIASSPPGADVYIGSRWIGKTPVVVLKPEEPEKLLVAKEGYRDVLLTLEPRCSDSFTLNLDPKLFDWETYVEERRDAFYYALSGFVLALPVPILCYSVTQDLVSGYRLAFTYNNLSEMDRTARHAFILYNGYLGGLFVTSALLVNSVIKLVQYLSVSTR